MKKKVYFTPISSWILVVVIALVLIILNFQRKEGQKMVSEFGKYQGYTQKVYDSSVRKSDFLTLSNGTRLAYDLIHPTKKGIPADEPLPVLFKYTPYLRTFTIFDKHGKDIFSDLLELGWKAV